MAVPWNSKFDLRRLARAVNGTVCHALPLASQEELGYCDKKRRQRLRIATIVVRGATDNFMMILNVPSMMVVNNFKCTITWTDVMTRAGAVEIELATQIAAYADTLPGLRTICCQTFSTAWSFP
ncbi:T-complex protein 1 subunit theta [Lucilia cuprina]|nr:T-complex protein 1 subunit theta [Lucilia cuprina]